MDERAFAKIMATLAALYPRFELKPATITAYRGVLGDLPEELLKAAALHCGATSTFFPAAAELRRAAFDLVASENAIPDAYTAFAEVMERNRIYDEVEWSHPLIERAVAAVGGQRVIGMTNEDDISPLRARFVDAYNTLLNRARSDQAMLPAVREVVAKLAAGYKLIGSGQS